MASAIKSVSLCPLITAMRPFQTNNLAVKFAAGEDGRGGTLLYAMKDGQCRVIFQAKTLESVVGMMPIMIEFYLDKLAKEEDFRDL